MATRVAVLRNMSVSISECREKKRSCIRSLQQLEPAARVSPRPSATALVRIRKIGAGNPLPGHGERFDQRGWVASCIASAFARAGRGVPGRRRCDKERGKAICGERMET